MNKAGMTKPNSTDDALSGTSVSVQYFLSLTNTWQAAFNETETFSRWILYRQSSGFTALKSFTITMNNCTKVMEIITDIFSNF